MKPHHALVSQTQRLATSQRLGNRRCIKAAHSCEKRARPATFVNRMFGFSVESLLTFEPALIDWLLGVGDCSLLGILGKENLYDYQILVSERCVQKAIEREG